MHDFIAPVMLVYRLPRHREASKDDWASMKSASERRRTQNRVNARLSSEQRIAFKTIGTHAYANQGAKGRTLLCRL